MRNRKITHCLKHFHRIRKKQPFFTFSTLSSLLPLQHSLPLFPKPLTPRPEFVNLLQLLESNNPISYHKKIHAQIVVSGFESDTFTINILLKVYAKCNNLGDARKLFDKMHERNLITWSRMVSMHTQHGFNEEALILFLGFRRSCDKSPSEYILASVVRACRQLGGRNGGSIGLQIHGFVLKTGFDQDIYVGTSLIDFYSKSFRIDEARMYFDGLSHKTAVTWTTIITGYAKSGKSEESLHLFTRMRETDVVPDRYVLSSVLNACSVLKFMEGGKQVHGHVLRRGTEMDVSVGNVLIDFYVKCGKVKIGRNVFDMMVGRNVISWTTMIAGYMQNCFDKEAMRLFVEMTRMDLGPDRFAFSSVLNSCSSLEALEEGRQVHAYIIKTNHEHDDFVKNGLIDMYAKCHCLTDSRRVFDVIMTDNNDDDVVFYNAMIEGYSRQESVNEALDLFREMREKSVTPTHLTFVSVLGVSASILGLELSKQIHGLMLKFGIDLDLFAGSALIDVYSKCSCIKDARVVFEEMKEKDIVVWNAMFFGYTQQFENEEALCLYAELQLSKEKANEFTFAALITASSNLASLQHGQQFHNQLVKMGLEFDPFVTNAIVDMYAKCGSFEDARKTFNAAIIRDTVCWNSMILSYAHHGEAEKAIHMFERMKKDGIKPNYVTFVGVLSACSHAGLVEDGFDHFESMSKVGIEPGTEHYACMVSLLGRAGKLYEAKEFIEKMPIKPAAVVWRSLLSGCRVSGNVELGKYAAEMAISMDPKDSGSYTLLSNIFASRGMWVDVKRVRERMDSDRIVKEPGRSWLEVSDEVHVFIARDRTHPKADLVYSVLDDLIMQIKDFGYVPDTTTLGHD